MEKKRKLSLSLVLAGLVLSLCTALVFTGPSAKEIVGDDYSDENEPFDQEKAERFPEFISGNRHQTFSFCEELLWNGTLRWDTTFDAAGTNGNLYKAGYSFLDFDKEARDQGIESRFKELELTFWVTEEEIYLIDSLTDQEKELLLGEGTLPENSTLVCCPSDVSDSLQQGEVGRHQSIEHHADGTVWYRSYSVSYKDFEPRNVLSLVWKQGEGLIGYKKSRTPAGADCLQIWNPEYLERDVVEFVQVSES